MIIKNALFVVWFFLPAGLANMTPIFAAKLPYLSRWSFPLDGYATFRGKRVFGSHKTIRGVLTSPCSFLLLRMGKGKSVRARWMAARTVSRLRYSRALVQLGEQLQSRRVVRFEAGRQLVHQPGPTLDQAVLVAGQGFEFSDQGTVMLQ